MKKDRLTLTISTCLCVLGHNLAAAKTVCDGTIKNPCVIHDAGNDVDVKYWRTAKMIHDVYKGNNLGLNNLWVSASNAPSVKGFSKIAEDIKKATQGKYSKIIDLDLRQESHGFLNENTITLAVEYDWINLGKTHQQAMDAEQEWIKALATQTFIPSVLTSTQFKSGIYSQGVSVPIYSVKSEKTVVENAGFQYVRLTVTDHMAPRVSTTDRFVTLIRSLPDQSWLHIHCSGGKGRSTTFMAMYDMLKNADKVSFTDIIKRQASVSPYYDLSELVGKDPVFHKYYVARLQFLMRFYQYSKASLNGYLGNWSDWIKDNPL